MTIPNISASSIDFEDKVAFLSDPENYSDNPDSVKVIETHMSRVFLTGSFAHKLKRPIEMEFLDFTTLEKRRLDCEREVRLNRRLAKDTYLGTVPITYDSNSGLQLNGSGEPVEWLVKMKRLPEDRMLDQLIEEVTVTRDQITPAALKLAEFYRGAGSIEESPEKFLDRLGGYVDENIGVLTKGRYDFPQFLVNSPKNYLTSFLDQEKQMIFERLHDGRIVEGHGDLRPQHICLIEPPVIFDCLEFKREYRILDPVDELSYLSLECKRLGQPEVGNWFKEIYREQTGDDYPGKLGKFYFCYRATLQAKLSVWHIEDQEVNHDQKWIERGQNYLELATHVVQSK